MRALAILAERAPSALRGPAIDVACGRGRHALVLARRGITTDAVDRDPAVITALQAQADGEGLPLFARVHDLEREPASLPSADDGSRATYRLIVVVNFLHRPLLPRLFDALAPGGALYYETFTVAQAAIGRPRNRDFLLVPGELGARFAALERLHSWEGVVDDGDGGRAARGAFLGVRRSADPAVSGSHG